jgi:CRP-like cAMP-binding protein
LFRPVADTFPHRAQLGWAASCHVYWFEGFCRVQPADYLKQIPLFSDLDPEEIMDVLRIARVVSFKAGAKLCTRGAKADCAYVLEHGEVSIRAAEDGQPEIELGRVGAGEILGELALIDGHPRSADVVALGDVRGYRIDRSELDAMRRAMHPAAFKIMRRIAITVSDRLRDVNDAIAQELTKSTAGAAKAARKSNAALERPRTEAEAPGPSRAAARVSREFSRTSREMRVSSGSPGRVSAAAAAPAPPARNSVPSKAAPKPRNSVTSARPAAAPAKKPPAPKEKEAAAEQPSFWRSMLDRLGGSSWK